MMDFTKFPCFSGYIAKKVVSVFCVLIASLQVSHGQTTTEQKASETELFKQKLNSNTVTILGGSITGTDLKLIDDMARTLSKAGKLRILPIRGGVVSNVRDILYLRGIDMGIVRADVIETFKGRKHYEDIEKRLNYISVLHHEEFHLLSSNPKIKSITDLKDKVVALHNEAYLSGLLLFKKLNITPRRLVKMNMLQAAEKTKSKEIDAIIRVTGKPFEGTEKLLNIDPNLKMIPIPFTEKLIDTAYFPTMLNHIDYPRIISSNEQIPTIAVHAILGVFNWKAGTERHRRLRKFTDIFFSNYNQILKRPGRHPKWSQVNLAAKLAGWKRFRPAEQWLAKARLSKNKQKIQKQEKTEKDKKKLLAKFKKFLDRKLTKKESDTLFSDFKKWRESQ